MKCSSLYEMVSTKQQKIKIVQFWYESTSHMLTQPEEITDKQLKGPKVTVFIAFNPRLVLLISNYTDLKKAIKRSMLNVIMTSSRTSTMIYRKRSLRANSGWPGSYKMYSCIQDDRFTAFFKPAW